MKRTRQKGGRPSITSLATPETFAADAVVALTPRCCRWPIGDPHVEGFRFCCERAEPGNPYCNDHMARRLAPR